MDFGNDMFAEDMMAQQMGQLAENQAMLQEQQAWFYQQQQFRQDRYGMRKVNTVEARNELANYLCANTGKAVTQIREVLSDGIQNTFGLPTLMRHCCAECGITQLPLNTYVVAYTNIQIPYYYCKGCGRLYVLHDFMNVMQYH